MVQKKSTNAEAPIKLTAHGLLGSISYWGTAARLLLVNILVVTAFVINISAYSTWEFMTTETFFLIYGLATLLLLDLGYVIVARSLKLGHVFDRWVVMMSDLVIAGFFVAPSFLSSSADGNKLRVMSLIVVLLVLAVRILLGLLFAKRKR